MKVLLIALNASYTHTNLAVRTLAACLRDAGREAEVYESTVNQPAGHLLREIAGRDWDAAAFSCYIWNIEMVRRLTAQLALIYPGKPILWGGPEVSHDTEEWMVRNPGVTYILRGEGEQALPACFVRIGDGRGMEDLHGVAYRDGDRIVDQGMAAPVPMDSISFPYTGRIEDIRDRILYYESSRGCPFSCGYCLSGASPGVRYRSLGTVKEEIAQLAAWDAHIVKFVDRTFNSDRARAAELFAYIASLDTQTLFHFEICADLLDEQAFAVLAKMPPGRAQFEIGVQSTSPAVLEASGRKTDISRIEENVKKLREMDINLHLDLIAGLPGETLESFADSFDRVWAMGAERLQVGFLKLLRGSALRRTAAEWRCLYAPDPPYEVLSTDGMSYADLMHIHAVTEMVERYANTGRYAHTLRRLIATQRDAFYVFDKLAAFIRNRYTGDRKPSLPDTYDDLYAFSVETMGETPAKIADLIRFDFVSHAKPKKYPSCLPRLERKEISRLIHSAFDTVRGSIDMPLYEGKAHVARFDYDVLHPDLPHTPEGAWFLFLYGGGNAVVIRLPGHS
jgi:radical SAM superfamily enzyme YgiQ (UPF0313 family)